LKDFTVAPLRQCTRHTVVWLREHAHPARGRVKDQPD
jgi:hypothetical protein